MVDASIGSHVCPTCLRHFKSYAGRRLHETRAHAQTYHEGQIKCLEDRRNKPWALEELRMMAEFEVSNYGHPFINQEISKCVLSGRSTDSINGKRKSQQYRDLLKDLLVKEDYKEKSILSTVPVGSHRESHVGGKRSWTSDDENSMIEFEVAHKNDPHINKTIQKMVLTWRTLESIRTKRRTIKYREMVAAYAQPKTFTQCAMPPLRDCRVNLTRIRVDGRMLAASIVPHTESQDGMSGYYDSMAGTSPIRVPDHGGSPPSSPDGSDGSQSSSESAGSSSEEEVTAEDVNSLKDEIFGRRPNNMNRINRRAGQQQVSDMPRSVRKRREYAATQRAWDKNRSHVAQNAILEKDPLASPSLLPGTVEFWTSLFGRPSQASTINFNQPNQLCTILDPTTIDDVEWCKRKTNLKTSPGTDGIRAADFRAAASQQIMNLYNLIIENRIVTRDWAKGRTTLLPKKDVPPGTSAQLQ
ncbi:uncharacterized protein [Palaemon carinicauda]|uniref:uncharacterized protein n=1 Tax=Palaemon carinicauda TaxID=392227 RepID=UPI0035B5B43C